MYYPDDANGKAKINHLIKESEERVKRSYRTSVVEKAQDILDQMSITKISIVAENPENNSVVMLKEWMGRWLAEFISEGIGIKLKRDGNSVVMKAAAGRGPGRPSLKRRKFRPDLVTLIDGAPIDRPATEVLRSKEFSKTSAGKFLSLLDRGKAKGARSAVQLGLENDANGDMPIFRVWTIERDEMGNFVNDECGDPVAIEIDSNNDNYVENIAMNKKKFDNKKLREMREKYPQPQWTEALRCKFKCQESQDEEEVVIKDLSLIVREPNE